MMSEILTGEIELARAVIMRAIEDAKSPKESLYRREARLFLCAKNRLWRNSLKAWCELAEWTEDDIIKWARSQWMN